MSDSKAPCDGQLLAKEITRQFSVAVPDPIIGFWERVGVGYFGQREFFFFGDRQVFGQESLIERNSRVKSSGLFPLPVEGGPVVFAETCFGDQLCWSGNSSDGECLLIAVDTMTPYVVAGTAFELFDSVLSERNSLIDPDRYAGVQKACGPLRDGLTYAPILTPLAGGEDVGSNFHLESSVVHWETAVAMSKALRR